ncbi:MAG: methylenetetrahydrofolate reductase, partial [Acidobacteriota bacterium]
MIRRSRHPGRLERALASGREVITCEIASGDSADPDDVRRRGRLVRDHVDAVNVPDNTAGLVHMSALAAAAILVREGIEPVMHVTCRDRNRMALQSDLLGAAALGVRNVLCLTGDHMVHGDHPQAKPVFDLDSIQLLALADHLTRRGRYLSGRTIQPPPDLFPGTTENPFAPPYDFRPLRLKKKIEAGARFVQTQIIFDLERFARFMAGVRELGLDRSVPILAGVAPLRSADGAVHMRDRVPGIEIPEPIIRRMRGAGPDRTGGEEEGLRICVEIIERVREIPGVAGIHLMPIRWEEAVPEIAARARLTPALSRAAPVAAARPPGGPPGGTSGGPTGVPATAPPAKPSPRPPSGVWIDPPEGESEPAFG